MITDTMISPSEMNAILAIHSCRAEPIIPEGWNVPNGYLLRGPRGNRLVVCVDHMGRVPKITIDFWVEGIAYGDAKAGRLLDRYIAEKGKV